MELIKKNNYLVNQLFVVSGVLSTILSCGLGLGYLSVFLDHTTVLSDGDWDIDQQSKRFIETAGEVAFVPSILIIPFTMQKKGRRIATIATIVPLIISWLISFDKHYYSFVIVNVLHNISLGGAVTISSVVISELCSPKYRGSFLMLETAMISLGVLLSHVSGIFSCWMIISLLGVITSVYSLVVIFFCPESPYWLICQGHIMKGTDSFEWLRGDDEDAFKELEVMMKNQRLKQQLEALKPIKKVDIKETTLNYVKSLLTAEFLMPLSIMILLFSFVGFGGENKVSGYSFRDVFKLTNGKYIGTIILDVLTLVCSLAASVLIQIVKRKTLFVFTGSFSVIFLAFTSLMLFLQSIELFSKDYTWLLLSLVTGFVMFMSLGTTALPFSLIGEIFPMSYKGIGSSLTCAYLWAFGNSVVTLLPYLTDILGYHGMLLLALLSMIAILIVLNKIMPETSNRTLIEIEKLMKDKKKESHDYNAVAVNDEDDIDNFDRLKLFIEV